MERKCPKCGKDFSDDKFWTTSLKRHLERKYPCDVMNGKYLKRNLPSTSRNDFTCMSFDHISPPLNYKIRASIAPNILKQIFDKEVNRCISWINIKNDDILILYKGNLEHINNEKLTQLCMLFLHFQVFPTLKSSWVKYDEFKEWLLTSTLVDLDDDIWNGVMPRQCEYYNSIRNFLKKYFGNLPSKRKLHTILSNQNSS